MPVNHAVGNSPTAQDALVAAVLGHGAEQGPTAPVPDEKQHFADLLASAGLEEPVSILVGDLYPTAADFSYSVPLAQVSAFIESIFSNPAVTAILGESADTQFHMARGRLRRFHESCHKVVESEKGPPQQQQQNTTVSSLPSRTAADSWIDLPAVKLTDDQIQLMRVAFENSYQGEILTDETMPGTRYLSHVF